MTHFDGGAARARLEAQRERVTGMIGELRREGPADQGSETFEREKDISILEGLESDLAEIEAALQRLDDGSYGIDEITGEPIVPERLEALPTARTNVDTPH